MTCVDCGVEIADGHQAEDDQTGEIVTSCCKCFEANVSTGWKMAVFNANAERDEARQAARELLEMTEKVGTPVRSYWERAYPWLKEKA